MKKYIRTEIEIGAGGREEVTCHAIGICMMVQWDTFIGTLMVSLARMYRLDGARYNFIYLALSALNLKSDEMIVKDINKV